MQPGMGTRTFHPEPHFNPYGNRTFVPNHATHYHTPEPPKALNRYAPTATITNMRDGRVVDVHTQLRPGEVVEVSAPGHAPQLQYATYSGHLKPLTASEINHVPNEIREHIQRIGGPMYFAHEIHNRLPTSGLYQQFQGQKFNGPNRPLI